jgi:hypothetical protein
MTGQSRALRTPIGHHPLRVLSGFGPRTEDSMSIISSDGEHKPLSPLQGIAMRGGKVARHYWQTACVDLRSWLEEMDRIEEDDIRSRAVSVSAPCFGFAMKIMNALTPGLAAHVKLTFVLKGIKLERDIITDCAIVIGEQIRRLPARPQIRRVRRNLSAAFELLHVYERLRRECVGTKSIAQTPSENKARVIDYEDIAMELAKQRKSTQAALVRYMRERTAATVEEIAEHVHRDECTSEKAMAMNATRTNDSLAALGVPLSFLLRGGYMHKAVSPE